MVGAVPASVRNILPGFALLTLVACSGGQSGADTTATPTANAPSAASASITTSEDTASAPTTPSVTDADAGETFTFAIVAQPAHGSASVVNNQLDYVPAADYNGPYSFTFRATDSTNLS